ncbi:zinc finger protein ZAT9-like [Ananas comosus]|uniref:Zinc finger protein ZAT9-like n=1 Tax=Ananas comosus TaxID=4615 RepID=A0A6P5EF38_ANACO|nr:zinc finger protein ZAT9-like [Ananas comosus]
MGVYNNTSQYHLGVDNSHPSLQNEENPTNESLADESESYLNANHKEVHTCPECRRTFPSVKAMHGHLRTHPNKGYKGAVPPPNIAKKQLVQPSSTSAPQIEIPVSQQPITIKIDHTSIPMRDSNRLIDLTAEATSVALSLVYMSIETSKQTANPSREKKTNRSPKRKRENMENDFRVIKDKEETAEQLRNGESHEGEDHSGDHQIDGDDDKEYIKESHLQPSSSLIEKKKKKIKKLAGPYPCSVCDKFFSTHQALGGHMASHNKSKNIMDEVFTENEANKAEQSHVAKPMVETVSKGSDLGIHKCKKCDQIFTSGQALGGHQRKHNPLPDHSRKENNIALYQDQKESNVAPEHSRKESLPDHNQKESNVAFNHFHKENNIAPDHGRKKISPGHSQKQNNDVSDDHRKESNAMPDHSRT